ncbi:MAG TPA: glycosyl transferase family 90 [Burkholderiaceae bacterium]|nr:glycosyl transferase family 90 [Burkholderiaceae bacterium]
MAHVQKKIKFFYYLKSYARILFAKGSKPSYFAALKSKLSPTDLEKIQTRVAYYNKVHHAFSLPHDATQVRDLLHPVTPKSYFFDTYEYAQYFDPQYPLTWVFGDVITVPKVPSIVKSRPISDGADNANSVVMNLDKVRHFRFVTNDKPFLQKKNMLIGRAGVYQKHRIEFFEKYFNHPLCDLGQVNKAEGRPELWYKPKISVSEHLEYKFVLSLQGNDVATNLKWIMSSNSIAVTPKPTYETWFMEGTLVGGKHFIEIKSDYSDLEAQLQYYLAHPDECQTIIQNAHAHCQQFNPAVEDVCSMMVLEQYFANSRATGKNI